MKRRKFLNQTVTTATMGVTLPFIVPFSVFGKNAPSNKINIGQIGCGRIARDHDMAETLKHNIARIIAACDVDRNRLEDGKRLIDGYYSRMTGSDKYMDTKMYDDYREMLLNKEIDAVMISTPDHWHSQPAMEAALAGKHIYLQKPTSLTISEGRQLANIVKSDLPLNLELPLN